MTDPAATSPAPRVTPAVGVALAVLVFVVGLLWSKWLPYAGKIIDLDGGHGWSGANILGVGGVQPGDPPSWHAATTFFTSYAAAVWKALLAALLISAALQALVPRRWLLGLLNRRGRFTSALAGGLASTPSMMCTCCTAPVAVGLRRSGVSTAAAVAYWLGNPLLNPAVVVFLLFVAPWQWTATRVVVGAVTVVVGSALVAALTERPGRPAQATIPTDPTETEPTDTGSTDTSDPGQLAIRFCRALLRLAVVLIPEYLVMVLLIGGLRGWLFPLGHSAASYGVIAVLVAAVVGTFLVIPTAGEIPILQGLALLGLSSGVVGALLITLPAVSLPGIAMIARSFGWRTTVATTLLVVIAGVLGGAALSVL